MCTGFPKKRSVICGSPHHNYFFYIFEMYTTFPIDWYQLLCITKIKVVRTSYMFETSRYTNLISWKVKILTFRQFWGSWRDLKGVFAKNRNGYGDKLLMVIATNLTSICCVYEENIDKNDSCWRTYHRYIFRKL